MASYLHFIPALVLAYAAGNKLWSCFSTLHLGLLSAGEVLGNVVLPLVELAIAVLLISLASPAVVIVACCLFSFYAGYLIQLLWNGESSCGCLGARVSNAHIVLAADIICLSLLAHCSIVSHWFRSRAFVVFLLGAVPIFALLWGIIPNATAQAKAVTDPGPLRSRFAHAEMIPASTDFTTTVEVSNRTHKPIEVKEIFASCGCTDFEPKTLLLAPGASAQLQLKIDLMQAYKKSSQEGEAGGRAVDLSISRFNDAQQPLDIFLNGRFILSTTDESARVALDTPQSTFEMQTIRVNAPGAKGDVVEFDVEVFATPLAITWLTSNTDAAGFNAQAGNAVSGNLLTDFGDHCSDVSLQLDGDSLVLHNSQLAIDNASYLWAEFVDGDGMLQRQAYPLIGTEGAQ